MPLPSQSSRSIGRHAHMYRRSSKRKSPAKYGIFLVIIGAIGFYWMYFSGDDPVVHTDPPSLSLGLAPPLQQPGVAIASPTFVPEPAPVEISTPQPPVIELPAEPAVPSTPLLGARQPAQPAPQPATPNTPAGRGTLTPIDTSSAALAARGEFEWGRDAFLRNRPLEARTRLSNALLSGRLEPAMAREARQICQKINESLVFGDAIMPDDPHVGTYAIRSGDSLSMLPRQLGLQTDWRLLQRINQINEPRRIRPGHTIKIISSAFHVVVDASAYRMDLYMDNGSERVFVRSFDVGLGSDGGTPTGSFIVRSNSKLINPEWRNPRTRELWHPDDPGNPIGEHWIGIDPADTATQGHVGYGIHGTIEPSSIGRDMSMGCVRMRPEEVAMIWELLVHPSSTITILP